MDRRYLFNGSELRVDEHDGKPMIVGHAAIFDEVTTLWPGQTEVVRRGAFLKTVHEADVRGLFNHDVNWLLGRNRAGTLALREDDRGLEYRITAPATDLVHDLVLEPIRRRDLTGSSFSFDPVKTNREEKSDGVELRELLEVKLYDVGPVTFPQYPGTDTQLRAAFSACKTMDEISFLRALRGGGLTDDEISAMVAAVGELVRSRPTPRVGTPLRDRARLRLAEQETL